MKVNEESTDNKQEKTKRNRKQPNSNTTGYITERTKTNNTEDKQQYSQKNSIKNYSYTAPANIFDREKPRCYFFYAKAAT